MTLEITSAGSLIKDRKHILACEDCGTEFTCVNNDLTAEEGMFGEIYFVVCPLPGCGARIWVEKYK